MIRTIPRWLKSGFFPLLHTLTYGLLFWLITGFFVRDTTKIAQWTIAGIVIGLLSGIALQKMLQGWTWINHPYRKPIISGSILLLECALGLLIIGPFIWILLRFVPTSNIHSICCETPAEYGASQFENVHLSTDDGATIAGWYVAPGSQAGKVIILIHGNGYDRRGTDFQTRQLITAGYGVLLYDLRDHGESRGKLNAFNRMSVYAADLQHVVDYLKQKPEVNPKHIGVVGLSLGAFATLNITTETLNSFAALWLDGLVFENFGALPPPATVKEAAKSIFDHQTRLLARLYYPEPILPPTPLLTQIIPTIKYPKVMIVASGLDERERKNNEKLIPLMGGNKSIWFISNAWHIGGRFEVPEEYSSRMLTFFAQAFVD